MYIYCVVQFLLSAGGKSGKWHNVLYRVWHHHQTLSTIPSSLCTLPHQPVLPRQDISKINVSFINVDTLEINCVVVWESCSDVWKRLLEVVVSEFWETANKKKNIWDTSKTETASNFYTLFSTKHKNRHFPCYHKILLHLVAV